MFWFNRKRRSKQALRILLVTNSLVLLAGYMFGPIYAMFVEDIGGDLLDASIAGGLFALAGGVVTLMSGKYSDKIKENELMIVLGYILIGIGFMAYVFVDTILLLFIVQVIIGFGEAVYSPAFDAVYSKHLDGEHSGGAWGVWEGMNYFTYAIGAVVGGVVATYFGFTILFIAMSALCLLSAVYIYFLPRKAL